MQCFDNGPLYTVTVATREVEAFRRAWPCSGLRGRPVTFQFDKRTGDLVDSNDTTQHPSGFGPALAALSDDAMRYGAGRLGLTLPC